MVRDDVAHIDIVIGQSTRNLIKIDSQRLATLLIDEPSRVEKKFQREQC